MRERIEVPIYRKIALDVATRIYHGDLREGEKIRGRSTLAGEYNVSPETIRRAMSLLEDMNVVVVTKGSGVYIKSKKSAFDFLEYYQSKETVGTLKNEIHRLMGDKKRIEEDIKEVLDKIIDYSDRLKYTNPINPIEIDISEESGLLGKTIAESKFWQHTGGTIIGIRRNHRLILSPGPYAEFEKGDTILVIGDMEVLGRIKQYIGV